MKPYTKASARCECCSSGLAVHMSGGRDTASLSLDRGRVAIVEPEMSKHGISGGDHIAQLILRTDEPWEISDWSGIELGEAPRLMEPLFP